jgi:hypothetical protein
MKVMKKPEECIQNLGNIIKCYGYGIFRRRKNIGIGVLYMEILANAPETAAEHTLSRG